tara:strand:- start:80 stop:598 length:519 start_codon:yes stop_codon:yes gene_type:complete
MKKIIKKVLDEMSDSQINLASDSARETISNLISATLKSKGHYREYPTTSWESSESEMDCDICGDDTSTVEYDYIGSGTNHLQCELESEKLSRSELVGKAYNEIVSDGLPQGGDVEAMKLAEAIVDDMEGEYMYESPDGGKTIYKRPVGNYDSKDKVELTKDEWDKIKGNNEN